MTASVVNESWHENKLMALQQSSTVALRNWQKTQLQQFTARGFPHRKIENWKYTNVNEIAQQTFTLAKPVMNQSADIQHFMLKDAHVIVFVNGYYVPQLSRVNALPPGVVLTNLATMVKKIQWQSKWFMDENYQTPFSVLNDALFANGLFLAVPSNICVDNPIQLIYFTDAKAAQTMSHPRHLMTLGENSQAIVIEEYIGINDIAYFNNVVCQIEINANASLALYKLQQEGNQAFHIANTIIQQKQASRMTSYHLSMGGKLSRDDLNYALQETRADCQLWGYYHPRYDQHIDYHTRIDHYVPQCESFQNYKGIIDDHGHAVFNGKIVVHAKAQKTRAHQSNKNLLLSKTASIDTKPELEIYADEVQCTHGATVGQIDPQILFYLRSRGIDKTEAQKLLMQAFVYEIIGTMPHADIAKKIQQQIYGKSLW